MDKFNADIRDNEHIASSIAPFPLFCPCLPSICETTEFSPILDPLAEQPFHKEPPVFFRANVIPDSLEEEKPKTRSRLCRQPIQPVQQLESELWAAHLSFCSKWQLDAIPGSAEGIPNQFDYHPFRFLDHREQARIRKQAAAQSAQKVTNAGECFSIDFGFLLASSDDLS